MEDRLRNILIMVNDWLKYAEAKNGALLAANIAILVGLIQFSDSKHWTQWMYIGIILIGLSLFCSLFSFLPQLKVSAKRNIPNTQQNDNSLLFYAHIAQQEPSQYYKYLCTSLGLDSVTESPLLLDYTKQIVTNSRIALRKNRLFSIGLGICISGIILVIIFFLVGIISN